MWFYPLIFTLTVDMAEINRYRCAKYRGEMKCKASFVEESIPQENGSVLKKRRIVHEEHTCGAVQHSQSQSCGETLNVKVEMKELCAGILQDPGKTPNIVANEVFQKIDEKYRGRAITTHTTEFLKSLVIRTRAEENGDCMTPIVNGELSKASDDDSRSFLQFMTDFLIDGKMTKIIGWGHPDLIHLVKYGPVYTFIDCTFSCCPKGFYQCMIIMVYDPSTSMYVPVFYVLLQTKKEMAYWQAISQCIIASDFKLKAKTTTCDFERGLHNAVQEHFPDSPLVGCKFHWKQALRRKLIDLRVPKDIISRLVDPDGLINILTVIPIEDIESKGIPYIRAHFDEEGHTSKFDAFWKYFRSQWIHICDPNSYNINGILEGETPEGRMINTTKKTLERYNRKLNTAFPHPNPTMIHFVKAIRRISNEYVVTLLRIKNRQTLPPVHKSVYVYVLPDAYTSSDIYVASTTKSKYVRIAEFRHLIGKTHYDDEDELSYITTKISIDRHGDVLAHRQLNTLQQGGRVVTSDNVDAHTLSAMEVETMTY
jgi:hypothetical protein